MESNPIMIRCVTWVRCRFTDYDGPSQHRYIDILVPEGFWIYPWQHVTWEPQPDGPPRTIIRTDYSTTSELWSGSAGIHIYGAWEEKIADEPDDAPTNCPVCGSCMRVNPYEPWALYCTGGCGYVFENSLEKERRRHICA